MLSKPEREQIIALIKREVVPAIGCTEPIAVALCVAKAREILGTEPEKVSARLSANILKNAMGVGIPGTGMIGLPIAIALGALVGRSEYQLEVLKDSDAKAVERGKRFIEQGRIDISLKEGITEKLYIEIEVSGGGHSAVAIIAGGHTNFVFISRDGETLQESRRTSGSEQEAQGVELNLRKVFDFAMTTPLDEIRFILEAKRLNKAAAEDSFKNNYGHCVGNTLRHAPELRIIGDCALSRILSYTCAACDARMAGAMVPVMSNSGSGNQGIATTLPVVVYAEEIKADEEHPSDRYLYQAEPGTSFGLVRLCRGGDRFELRHHLPDGRRVRGRFLCREEYDRQPDGYDVRRCEAELFAQVDDGSFDGCAFGDAGYGEPFGFVGRGHYRRRCR